MPDRVQASKPSFVSEVVNNFTYVRPGMDEPTLTIEDTDVLWASSAVVE